MTSPVHDIIDAKGGPAAFAAKVGKPAGTVRVWRSRKIIPRNAWPDIIDAFPDITLDVLRKVEDAA